MTRSIQTDFFKETQSSLNNLGDICLWWQLTSVSRESVERLYQGDVEDILRPHQIRNVDEKSYALEVLTPSDQDGMIGQARMDLDVTSPIEEQLDLVLEMAQNNLNKAWRPVEAPTEPYPEVATADPKILDCPETVLLNLEDKALKAIQDLANVKVTTAELYVRKAHVERLSSTGVTTQKDLSDIYFEIAMEQTPDHKNQEVNSVVTSVSSTDLDLKVFIEKIAEETLSLGQTQEPKTTESAVILVDAEAISSFLLAIKAQLNCADEYYQFPHLKEEDVFEYEGDALSLSLDPYMDAMVDSSPYTGDGFVAQEADLIVKGTVKTQIIGNRFGQYLDKTPNAIMGNMIVPAGTVTLEELRGKFKEYIEVIKFSSLLVDDHKLTWSSEIKLAKHHHADGRVTLLKGGVVSGNVRENLKHCYFSKELSRVNFPGTGFYEGKGYWGPASMLILSGVSIVGTE
jgi:predicted Zn-dependent protease